MSDIFDLLKRFPWLPSLKEYYSEISSKDPIIFINDIFTTENYKEINARILRIFNATFHNIEEIPDYIMDEINIYVYLVLRILLYILDNKTITNRIANIYSKTVYNELNKENEFNLYYIYKDLGLDVRYEEEPIIYKKKKVKDYTEPLKTNFRIFFTDYLKHASNLRDEYRKLVNSALMDGFVYIQPKNLNRLIQEYVRTKVLTQDKIDSKKLNEFKEKIFTVQDFKNLYNEITEMWESKKDNFEFSLDVEFEEDMDISKIFPPCTKEILSKAKEGQNLIHTERLFILWFLNALKFPEDKIINVFSTLPDFDREKTTYQVKYAIKKGYTPYSCKSLKSYVLCMANKYKDELCKKGYYSRTQDKQKEVLHPLAYVRIKKYRMSRESKTPKNQNLKSNEGT
jgi:DNA primase large subunit